MRSEACNALRSVRGSGGVEASQVSLRNIINFREILCPMLNLDCDRVTEIPYQRDEDAGQRIGKSPRDDVCASA